MSQQSKEPPRQGCTDCGHKEPLHADTQRHFNADDW